jgi:hypothetical protein
MIARYPDNRLPDHPAGGCQPFLPHFSVAVHKRTIFVPRDIIQPSLTGGRTMEQPTKLTFFDTDQLPGYTIADLAGEGPQAQEMIELFGRELVTKTILQSAKLSVFHEKARPGERVKPHRHGTLQVDYVLCGELIFGNQRVSAGMGYVIPDTLYSWRAGDEGAEWIEIHAGEVGIFTERNGS